MILRSTAVLLALLAAVAAPAAVLADAELLASSPGAGATVSELTQVVLTFDEPLNAAKSSVVLRTGGRVVAEGGVDSEDQTKLVVLIDSAQPGEYEVRYTANSQDGHLVRDRFTFVFAAPAATPSATAAATARATAAPSGTAAPPPTVQPTPAPSGGPPVAGNGGGTDVVIPIVAALALVGVAGAWFLRRRR